MSSGGRNYSKFLTGNLQLGPYPMEKLKKVEKPTTVITDNINRFDARQTGFARALRGQLGEISRGKHSPPGSGVAISSAMTSAISLLGTQEGSQTYESSPPILPPSDLPDDPEILSRHIKGFAYFPGADIVGICKSPSITASRQTEPSRRQYRF